MCRPSRQARFLYYNHSHTTICLARLVKVKHMKQDLDRLMAERELDALIVVAGGHGFNAPLHYLTGGVAITGGMALKARGAQPVIVANGMETEEAAATGLTVYTPHQLGYQELYESVERDRERANVLLWGRALAKLGLESGRVGLYGEGNLSQFIDFVERLREQNPQYTFVGEPGMSIFDHAAITKDHEELARIFSVAERTSEVVIATRDFISRHRASPADVVLKDDDTPLTIGDVKRFVRHQLLDRDLEESHMIFAQGRDGGYPHSRGDDRAALRLGEAIVFDLFPHEIGGGYHHDMTRTWSIGYARDDVREAYEQVMTAFDLALEVYKPGAPSHLLQEAVQDYFESLGHPTARSAPGTQAGYVHSLGHGIGLNIHERPAISHQMKDDRLQPGNVITIEPGLYYPERGFGIRIEDTFYINDSGELISLTQVPKDLIVPLRGG